MRDKSRWAPLLAAAILWACSSGGAGPSRSTGELADAPSSPSAPTPSAPNAGNDGLSAFPGNSGFTPPPTFGPGAPGTPNLDPESAPFSRDDSGMAGIDSSTLERLRAGGDCSAPILYPYEGAMMPAGLPSPAIMWRGNTQAALVTINYIGLSTVNYQFAASGSNPGEVTIPQDAWDEITHRTQGNASLNVTVNAEVEGKVSSCNLTLRIAPGTMVGSIYYNTYNAPGVSVPGNGAVMRLSLGDTSSEIYLQFSGLATPVSGPCISCHSVSFDGSTIVASTHSYLPALQTFEVFSYPITDAVQPTAGPSVPNANFGALTPDGAKMLAIGNPQCTDGSDSFPRAPNNFPLVEGPEEARLIDVKTGQQLQASGLSPEWYMWMPQFSPAGDKIVFNHAKPDGNGGTDRRELAMMDFDSATNTFSNLRTIAKDLGPAPSQAYQPIFASGFPSPTPPLKGCMNQDPTAVGAINPGACDGPCYPAYPFFTPDGRAVVFAMINQPDFASAIPGRTLPAKGELWYADLETGDVIPLGNANRTLDPGEASQEYYPTMLPVPVGGHFWIVWTSRRSWGHRSTGDPNIQIINPAEDPFRKRLWAAAIRPKPGPEEEIQVTGDPSYPGFYLEGQSISGNVRGFAALNPCAPTAGPCTSGLDCCSGFCAIEPGALSGICNEEPPECSKTNEKCETNEDCCLPGLDEPTNVCIAGFCNFLTSE